jgi:hypothetical protein
VSVTRRATPRFFSTPDKSSSRPTKLVSGGLDNVAEPGVAQFGPQPGDKRLQRVTGISRRVVRPDLLGQRPSRRDTPGVQRQQGEQNAQLTAADRHDAPSLVRHLKRAK